MTFLPVFRGLWLAVLGHVESPSEVVLAELAAVDLLREVDHGARRPAARLVAQDDRQQRHVHLIMSQDGVQFQFSPLSIINNPLRVNTWQYHIFGL